MSKAIAVVVAETMMERQYAMHRNFWNLSTKVGGAATRKAEPIPQFCGFRSIQKFTTLDNFPIKRPKVLSFSSSKLDDVLEINGVQSEYLYYCC